MKKYENKAKEILQQMTLKEKAELCSGSDFWHTKGVERLGIDKIMVTDGPHGLRKQAGESDHLGINESVPATCFPTAATIACSFDTELLEEMGKALGEECLQEEVAVLLGPGANIKRSPLCGRNFEYFSEDPYLTGKMSSALIKGVQEKGVGTSMKHYAANNQETQRMVIDAAVDERALREIYLAGYEMAVKEAQPWTLMCCYNQVNGEFGSQNKTLLTDILRDEWGFEGLVMTDWGAIVNRVKGLAAGLDLEMPYAGPENDTAILEAVQNGELAPEVLDTAVLRILCMLLSAKDEAKPGYKYNAHEHHNLAQRVAAESAVLLKNEGELLPLDKKQSVAIIGAFAETPRYQGAGSSRINPTKLENLYSLLKERGINVSYAPGYSLENGETTEELLAQAEANAHNANTAIVCIGLPDECESEGFDREHMRLPESHVALLNRVARSNPNTVVLLFGGSAIEMPWLTDAKALLMLYLGGQAGASAAADLLFGEITPSGKLAESFPHKLEDNSSYKNFPGGKKAVHYRESIYVGYRYYDKAEMNVLFPFGYGLSYTNFEYSDLQLEKNGDNIFVSVKIKNTGNCAGAEAVQFYVSQKNPSVFKPVRELKGFKKIFLQAGEEKTVNLTLCPRAFSYYSTDDKDFIVEQGEYTVAAAASSRDIRCEKIIQLSGAAPKQKTWPEEYMLPPKAPLDISETSFAQIYQKNLPALNSVSGAPITINSTMEDIAATKTGQALFEQIKKQGSALMPGDDGDGWELMFQRMLAGMPIRSLKMFSGGEMDNVQIDGLIAAMNEEIKTN